MLRLGELALRPEAWRTWSLGLLLLLGVGNACTTNHDALARQPNAGSSSGGTAGSSGFGTGGFGNTGNEAQGGRQNPDDEPLGDNVLTVVNGVIDAPSVRLCFARLGEDGLSSEFPSRPLPELAYGASSVLTSLDGLSLEQDIIQPWVIAGELSRLKKVDCAAAVALAQSEEARVTPPTDQNGAGGEGNVAAAGGAGGVDVGPGAAGAPPALPLEMPTLRARALAALPAGTVNIGRSILMVLTGCMGGAYYTDHVETSACGADYTPSSPTLQPVVVKLSRALSFDKVGLQGVHASLATGSVDVRASGDKGAVALVFASGLTFGQIEPRPADVRFSPFELGIDKSNFGLQAIGDGGDVLYQASWSEITASSGLEAIAAARTYTAVLLGPDPHLLKQGWWNTPAFSLIDNDPTR